MTVTARKMKRDLTVEEQLARGPMDLPFLMLTLMLTGLGLVMVFSASYATAYYDGVVAKHDPTYYFARQALFGVIGIVFLYGVSRLNYQHYRWLAVFALMFAFLCLILVFTPLGFGKATTGAQRWIRVPGLGSFQPSEAAKLGVILYFSSRLSKRSTEKRKKYDLRKPSGRLLDLLDRIGFIELVPYMLILGAVALLMLMEPHMSGTILILVAGAAVLFAGGVKLGWFVAGGTVVGAGLWFIMTKTSYMAARLAIWKDPWSDPLDKGYQTIQSLYAIGSGGLLGVGLGNSRHSLRPAGHPGLLDRPPRPGPVRRAAGGGHHHPGGGAGVPEHRRGHQSDSPHRYLPALLQLRRYGTGDTIGGNGNCVVSIKADTGPQTGIIIFYRPRRLE